MVGLGRVSCVFDIPRGLRVMLRCIGSPSCQFLCSKRCSKYVNAPAFRYPQLDIFPAAECAGTGASFSFRFVVVTSTPYHMRVGDQSSM